MGCSYNFLWLAFPSTFSLNQPSIPWVSAHPVCTFQLPTMVCMCGQAGWRLPVVLFYDWVHAYLSETVPGAALLLVLLEEFLPEESRNKGSLKSWTGTQLPVNPWVLVLSPHGPVATLGLKLCCWPGRDGHNSFGFQGSTGVANSVLGTSCTWYWWLWSHHQVLQMPPGRDIGRKPPVEGQSLEESLSSWMQSSASMCSFSLTTSSSFLICKFGKVTALTVFLDNVPVPLKSYWDKKRPK